MVCPSKSRITQGISLASGISIAPITFTVTMEGMLVVGFNINTALINLSQTGYVSLSSFESCVAQLAIHRRAQKMSSLPTEWRNVLDSLERNLLNTTHWPARDDIEDKFIEHPAYDHEDVEAVKHQVVWPIVLSSVGPWYDHVCLRQLQFDWSFSRYASSTPIGSFCCEP